MSGRTTRTRAAASTGGKMPKELRAKKQATPTKTTTTKSGGGRKAATPARKTSGAAATKAVTTRGRGRKAATVLAVDSEAEEAGSEEVPSDSDETMEEATADNTSDTESVAENTMVISDDEAEERLDVELTPKIGRSRTAGSSPPSTPKTPSPVKPARGRAARPKATPAKRAKESDSEDEVQEISPVKKAKVLDIPDELPVIPLPRRQDLAKAVAAAEVHRRAKAAAEEAQKKAEAAQAKAEAAQAKAAQTAIKHNKAVQAGTPKKNKVEVVISPRKASTKSKATAAKSAKAPDSGSQFFLHETDDEDKARLQRRLFAGHVPEPLPVMKEDTNTEAADRSTYNSDNGDISHEDSNAEATAMQVLVADITSKLSLDIDDPEVVDATLKDTYEGLPVVRNCDALTSDGAAINTVPYTEGLLERHDINPSALKRLVTFSTDGAFVINPARFDPAKVSLVAYGGSMNKVVSFKAQSGLPSRAICMSLGYVFGCNVVVPTTFGKQQAQTVKSVLFGPVRAEWERTMGFFGSVFDQGELPVSTFTASGQYVGVNMRTFPSDPAPALPKLSFIGATPSKRTPKQGAQGGSGKGRSVPSHSLLEMRDKTTWNTHDDIGVWDGTEYFKMNKTASLRFSFDEVHNLPRLSADPKFGDIIIVLYSTSSYVRDDKINLSLNLYGVVLVARAL